jgi:hypothetical protein
MPTAWGDARSCGSLFGPLACGFPVPSEQFVQLMALGSTGNDALEHIGQIGRRIKTTEFCCGQ